MDQTAPPRLHLHLASGIEPHYELSRSRKITTAIYIILSRRPLHSSRFSSSSSTPADVKTKKVTEQVKGRRLPSSRNRASCRRPARTKEAASRLSIGSRQRSRNHSTRGTRLWQPQPSRHPVSTHEAAARTNTKTIKVQIKRQASPDSLPRARSTSKSLTAPT